MHWQPPLEGLYKANFDAAYFGNLGMAGIGVIVRDSVGEILLPLVRKSLSLIQWMLSKL